MLQEMIRNISDKRELTFKQIAHSTGISPSSISNFLNEKSEIGFYAAFKIVRYLLPEQESEVMNEYCLKQKKPENLRLSMEYASIQNMTDLLGKLVESQLHSNNVTNRDWAKVYELDYRWKRGKIKPFELLERNRELQVKSIEMIFMRYYFDFNSYYYQKERGLLYYITENMNAIFKELTDPFLFKCFYARLHSGLAKQKLFNGELENARFYAQKVIDDQISLEIVATMYHLLGLSYLYESGSKALDYLHRSKELFKKLKNDFEYLNIDRSILFVSNYWGIQASISIDDRREEPEYLQEVAFQEIRNGNLIKAKHILQSIKEETLDIGDKAFQNYYLGLCTQNTDYFYKSLALFNESGNKFYGKLPCIELLKAGEKEIAVTTAYGKSV